MIETVSQTEQKPLTKRQLADYFNVSQRCIEQWMARGLVPYLKLGKCVRFDLETVKSHLREHCQVGGKR